jgi:hypothetical protein
MRNEGTLGNRWYGGAIESVCAVASNPLSSNGSKKDVSGPHSSKLHPALFKKVKNKFLDTTKYP